MTALIVIAAVVGYILLGVITRIVLHRVDEATRGIRYPLGGCCPDDSVVDIALTVFVCPFLICTVVVLPFLAVGWIVKRCGRPNTHRPPR